MGCQVWVAECRVPSVGCQVLSAAHPHAQKSPYPVILSLENHCGLEQQATMARHMKAILGDRLLTQPLQGQDPDHLPSPEVRPPPCPQWVPVSPPSPELGPASCSS